MVKTSMFPKFMTVVERVSNKILYVDDDHDGCELIEYMLSARDFEVVCCGAPAEALRLARENKFAVIILEYRLPGTNGVELCRQIRRFDVSTPVIFFTASAFPHERRAVWAAGAQAYLLKPNDIEKLSQAVIELTGMPMKP